MPSRRLSLASGHSGSQSCSKRPSGRLVGLIGRLSHTSACGRCSFLSVFKVHRNQVRCFRGLGVPQEGSFNASEASSIGGHPLHLQVSTSTYRSALPPTGQHFHLQVSTSTYRADAAQTPSTPCHRTKPVTPPEQNPP